VIKDEHDQAEEIIIIYFKMFFILLYFVYTDSQGVSTHQVEETNDWKFAAMVIDRL